MGPNQLKHCTTGCMIIELPVEEPENLFSFGTRILNMFTPGKVVWQKNTKIFESFNFIQGAAIAGEMLEE